ncbi:hypothetical protein [Paraferrimonas sedimenticola]|uniref:Uncharacterized protein n=1 Tax=Paraferrimonas sedimenticola TaxID=375674 RepID=A0AA37VYS5_9GAMM|nr:hypothetical protein [Paraferrimonas sedimenticola]GLP95590.1 hypothetical protein GCM10007895_08960 [Paraferrimonas sedimenticola]
MQFIQLQASTQQPINSLTLQIRERMASVCGGIDDMTRLGNKALVVRAEIYPEKLAELLELLSELPIKLDAAPPPKPSDTEAIITLQVTSYAGDTDAKVTIPKVPG